MPSRAAVSPPELVTVERSLDEEEEEEEEEESTGNEGNDSDDMDDD